LRSALDDDPELRSESFRESLGRGVRARVQGREVTVGSLSFVESLGVTLPDDLPAAARNLEARALSPLPIAVDGEALALAGVGDPVREDAAESLRQLGVAGHELHLLSGDRQGVVRAVADALGVFFARCRGEVSPEDKLAEVRCLRRRGCVFMVGDGVNDAAALAAADVGIAVSGGAEVSMDAADVYIGNPGVAPLVELVRGARRTMSTIRLTLGLSFGYNVVVAALAMAGWLTPLIAAVLMPISSLAVVTLALRARRFGDE